MGDSEHTPMALRDDLITTFLGSIHAPTPLGAELLAMDDNAIVEKIGQIFQTSYSDIVALEEVLQQHKTPPCQFFASHRNLLAHIRKWKSLVQDRHNLLNRGIALSSTTTDCDTVVSAPAQASQMQTRCFTADLGHAPNDQQLRLTPSQLANTEIDLSTIHSQTLENTYNTMPRSLLDDKLMPKRHQRCASQPMETINVPQQESTNLVSSQPFSQELGSFMSRCWSGTHDEKKECSTLKCRDINTPQAELTFSSYCNNKNSRSPLRSNVMLEKSCQLRPWLDSAAALENNNVVQDKNAAVRDIIAQYNKERILFSPMPRAVQLPASLGSFEEYNVEENPNCEEVFAIEKGSQSQPPSRTLWLDFLPKEKTTCPPPPPHSSPIDLAEEHLARPSAEYANALDLLNAVVANLAQSSPAQNIFVQRHDVKLPPHANSISFTPEADVFADNNYNESSQKAKPSINSQLKPLLLKPNVLIEQGHEEQKDVVRYENDVCQPVMPRLMNNESKHAVQIQQEKNDSVLSASKKLLPELNGSVCKDADADASTQASSRRCSTRTSLSSTARYSLGSPAGCRDLDHNNHNSMLQHYCRVFHDTEALFHNQKASDDNTEDGFAVLQLLRTAAFSLDVLKYPTLTPVTSHEVRQLSDQLAECLASLAYDIVLWKARTVHQDTTLDISGLAVQDICSPADDGCSEASCRSRLPVELRRLPQLLDRITECTESAASYVNRVWMEWCTSMCEASNDRERQGAIDTYITRLVNQEDAACIPHKVYSVVKSLDLDLLRRPESANRMCHKEELRCQLHDQLRSLV